MIDWVSLFDFDGVSLVWKHGRGGVYVGSVAGAVNAGGYIQVKVSRTKVWISQEPRRMMI